MLLTSDIYNTGHVLFYIIFYFWDEICPRLPLRDTHTKNASRANELKEREGGPMPSVHPGGREVVCLFFFSTRCYFLFVPCGKRALNKRRSAITTTAAIDSSCLRNSMYYTSRMI